MNKIVLMGRLTKDPDIRYSQSAEPMCIARYTLAVNRRFKREGEPDADFINCVAFRRDAEFVEKYLKKGMQIAVSGRLQIRTYDDKNGQRQWMTEVVIEEQEFAESKASFEARGGSRGYSPPSDGPPQNAAPSGFSAISETLDSDDIPF